MRKNGSMLSASLYFSCPFSTHWCSPVPLSQGPLPGDISWRFPPFPLRNLRLAPWRFPLPIIGCLLVDTFPGRQCVFLGITHRIYPSEDIAGVILKEAYNTSPQNRQEGHFRPHRKEESGALATSLVALCTLCEQGYPWDVPTAKGQLCERM